MPDSSELMQTALLRPRGPHAQQLLQQLESGSRSPTCCISASGCFPDQGALPFTICSRHSWSVGLLGLSQGSCAASPGAPPHWIEQVGSSCGGGDKPLWGLGSSQASHQQGSSPLLGLCCPAARVGRLDASFSSSCVTSSVGLSLCQ